jgi:hypothetical protein
MRDITRTKIHRRASMRRTISGLVAAIALTAAGAAPAMACGYGGCYPYAYSVSNLDRLPDPETQYHVAEPPPQYYYADQGPTYTGPDAFAPYYPFYPEGAVSTWDAYQHRPYYDRYYWRHHYGFHPRHGDRYGYLPRHVTRYGYHSSRPVLRGYY